MTAAALAAVIRRHVHGPNLGFWCVPDSEDLPGVLAEALTAAGWRLDEAWLGKVAEIWPDGNPYAHLAGGLENVTAHQHTLGEPCAEGCTGFRVRQADAALALLARVDVAGIE